MSDKKYKNQVWICDDRTGTDGLFGGPRWRQVPDRVLQAMALVEASDRDVPPAGELRDGPAADDRSADHHG